MNKGEGKKFAIGALIGVAAGFITGILTAPKSGKETREDIKNTASKVVREAEKQLKQLHSELSDAIEEGKLIVKREGDKVKKGLNEALANAQVTQQKVKETISALRNGETDEPELKKAIKEATKAIDHLKSYFTK